MALPKAAVKRESPPPVTTVNSDCFSRSPSLLSSQFLSSPASTPGSSPPCLSPPPDIRSTSPPLLLAPSVFQQAPVQIYDPTALAALSLNQTLTSPPAVMSADSSRPSSSSPAPLAIPSTPGYPTLAPYALQPVCYSAVATGPAIPSPITPVLPAGAASHGETYFRFDNGPVPSTEAPSFYATTTTASPPGLDRATSPPIVLAALPSACSLCEASSSTFLHESSSPPSASPSFHTAAPPPPGQMFPVTNNYNGLPNG